MRRIRFSRTWTLGAGALLSLACNRVVPAGEPPPPPETSLEDFLPPAPTPTGDPQQAFAGVLAQDNLAQERIDGPAAQGLPGDLFLRNDKIRVVLQQPGRAMALLPGGGTIVDADVVRTASDPLFDVDNNPADGVGNDHWGEASLLLQLGRIIDVTRFEILADGSGGGAAAIRFFGTDDINDFINLPGAIPIPLSEELDPDRELGLQVAVDYVLEPGADTVQVRYTLFNPASEDVSGPLGALGDIGGISEPFIPTGGYGGVGFEQLIAGEIFAAPYAASQGPSVAYGFIPFYVEPDTQVANPDINSLSLVISGGLAVAYDVLSLNDLLSPNFVQRGFRAPAGGATTAGFDFVVSGRDVAGVETRYQELRKGITPTLITGRVLAGGEPVQDARVGVFLSSDDVLNADERPITVLATDADGFYEGALAPGSYLLVADAQGVLRDTPKRLTLGAAAVNTDFALPAPARLSYTVRDVTNANAIENVPARINVIGNDPNPNDARFRDVKASSQVGLPAGYVSMRHSRSGSSATDPEGAIRLEPGRYRVVVTRGMEYDRFEQIIDVEAGEQVSITADLTHVVDSTGYIKTDFHQHAVNSPDAPVDLDVRAVTYATEGTEFFASTDHDFRTDYEPVLEQLGLDRFVDSIVGEETTTFDYGHFNAYPLPLDPTLPNGGALDWGRGTAFLNFLPAEIFSLLRNEGARVVQINHPRSASAVSFQEYFNQARIHYDFAAGTITSNAEATNNETFRVQPGAQLFSDNFDVVELYNGFDVQDLNGDGVREEQRIDLILRDMFNMFSLGKLLTMVGTSDTHSTFEPVGSPGTFIRVNDDSEAAIEGNGVREAVLSALTGQGAAGQAVARDAIVSNAPFLRVTVNNQSAIGGLVQAQNGQVTLRVRIETPDWARVDTLEVFANQKFEEFDPTDPNSEPGDPFNPGPLTPDLCFTARQNRLDNDTCDANGPAGPLTITELIKNPATGAKVLVIEQDITVTLSALSNQGATGDAWIVIRAFGSGSLFPFLPGTAGADLSEVVEQGSSAIEGGTFPIAITNAILVDANNDNRYTSPF